MFIIKLRELYVEYSNVCDSIADVGRNLKDFELYYYRTYGADEYSYLGERLQRVHEKGASEELADNLADTIACDRSEGFTWTSDDAINNAFIDRSLSEDGCSLLERL